MYSFSQGNPTRTSITGREITKHPHHILMIEKMKKFKIKIINGLPSTKKRY